MSITSQGLPSGLAPVDASVLEGFRRASHLNRQLFMRMVGFEKHGRPGRAIMLLVLGGAKDGITQRELVETLHVSPPTASVILQKMEQHGLIERWNDEADQRLSRIRMTPKGRELSGKLSEKFSDYTQATLGSMPEADRREFARLLGVFADNMETALKGAPASDVSPE
jgi:MarR family transcriptional regulator, organic hydroperoxide resistance regulator